MKVGKCIFIFITIIIAFAIGSPPSSFSAEKKNIPGSIVRKSTKSSSLKNKSSTVNKKSTVYCCEKGNVVTKKMSVDVVKKNDETCSFSKSKVESYCGVCCKNGKTTSVTSNKEKNDCIKKSGRFYKSARECKSEDVYCCLNGDVKKVSAGECRKKSGKPYKNEKEARKNCGWCCAEITVLPATPGECKKKRGDYFTSRARADRECKEQPQCCINGKLFTYSKFECKGRKGKYYHSHGQAKKQCRANGGKSPDQKEKKNSREVSRLRLDKKPVLLPDLDIMKTSVNSNCFMKVTVRNTGGSIKAADHTAAKIHLSAGAGQISSKTKLTDIDPGGALRSPGGSITYTTSMRITQPSQATLIWMDTEHAITESNEINNGDDAILTCKTPLVWCCTEGKISRTTKGACKKVGGTLHKTEKEANKVCSGSVDSLPLTSDFLGMRKEKSAMTPIGEIRGTFPEKDTQSKIPEAVPMSLDRGLRIESPTSLHVFYQGETITVRYKFMQAGAAAGDIIFTAIHRGIGGGSVFTTETYDPLSDYRVEKEVELTFSPDAPVGEYAIIASHAASGAYGESDSFRVEMNSAQINFIQPDTGGLFHPGGTLNVRYQFSRRIEPGTITFDLYSMESSTPLATMTHSYNPGSADMPLQTIWLLDWPLSSGISCEYCFIVATHPNAIGTSNTFAIQPFGEGTAVDEPYDIEIVDIFREDDGVVKARIQVNGFLNDRIDIQVNSSVIRALVSSSHHTDVVVGEMIRPAIMFGADRYAEGETFEVTVDPLNRFHETDESNNTSTKTLYYWDSFGEIYVNHSRDRILSGGSIRVPCNLTSYQRSTFAIALTIKNYGSEPIRNFSRLVEVRQSGRRSIGGGRLGSEDFDAVVPSSGTVMGSAGETTIDAGEFGQIVVNLNDLIVLDDSTITFNMSGPIAAWSGIVNPYTVNFNFGRISMSGECLY